MFKISDNVAALFATVTQPSFIAVDIFISMKTVANSVPTAHRASRSPP